VKGTSTRSRSIQMRSRVIAATPWTTLGSVGVLRNGCVMLGMQGFGIDIGLAAGSIGVG
jgi:hypothetical protein